MTDREGVDMAQRTCSKCTRPVKARGMCQRHYRAWLKSPEGMVAEKGHGRPRKIPTPCLVAECDRPATSLGLCSMHRRRQKRTGRLDLPSLEERFFSHVTEGGRGCWEFDNLTPTGYGYFVIDKVPTAAHRWSYEYLVSPIPDGLDLDHLCRNRACVNPWHVEPVTPRVNILRGISDPAVNARKTECLRGHPFDDTNTYLTPDGRRMCRACQRARDLAHRTR